MFINPNTSLISLENQLHLKLELVLDQEHDLWALKSRVNWMIQGDHNASFYRVSVLAKRKRNHVALIKNDVGDWITEEREVMEFSGLVLSPYTQPPILKLLGPLDKTHIGKFSSRKKQKIVLP